VLCFFFWEIFLLSFPFSRNEWIWFLQGLQILPWSFEFWCGGLLCDVFLRGNLKSRLFLNFAATCLISNVLVLLPKHLWAFELDRLFLSLLLYISGNFLFCKIFGFFFQFGFLLGLLYMAYKAIPLSLSSSSHDDDECFVIPEISTTKSLYCSVFGCFSGWWLLCCG
jgi:hypothetical protein